MELLYAFGAAILFVVAVLVGMRVSTKNEEKAVENYLNGDGKQDIQTMETYLKDHQIETPSTLRENTKTYYMDSLLKTCNKHYKAIFIKSLEDAGYTKSVHISGFATIYYNSESAILVTSRMEFFFDGPCKKSGQIVYRYSDEQSNYAFFSLKELIEVYESFGKPYALEKHGQKMSMRDIYWYVIHPTSAGYKLADKASGAVIGGLLLGPVGALAGAMSVSKSHNKDEENEIEVIFGSESIGYWSVAKGEYSVKDPIEQLTEHFPEKRLPDRYQKGL